MKKVLVLLALALSLFAAGKDPLFTHITSDSVHKSTMGVQFSAKMLEKGHPVTIYLTDTGVRIASKGLKEYGDAQDILAGMIKKGATVYICPMCMKQYGIEGKDLLEGIKLGNADSLEAALFAPNTATINW